MAQIRRFICRLTGTRSPVILSFVKPILAWFRECPIKEVALVGKAVPTCVAAVATAISKSDGSGFLYEVCKAHILAIVVSCAVIILISTFVEFSADNSSMKRRKQILDDLHDELFGRKANSFQDNRVTLYRRKGDKLVPDCRAGTLYSTNITQFKIDDNHPAKNEGVTGQIWAKKQFENVGPLPEYQKDPNKYMRACNIKDSEMASNFKFHARSICGTLVLNARNEEWGVLVLDSVSPTGVGDISAKDLISCLKCLKYVL